MKKILVSSTFKDMHFERDVLMNKLLPRLNEELFPHGESVDFIDLRWGIDTTELEDEESNKKILGVCLDEIDEAKPYIIVLIGDRYGWIPPKELLLDVAGSKGVNVNNEAISVTDLEITYSAFLSKERNDRVLFFFRDDIVGKEDFSKHDQDIYYESSEEMKEKLASLKRRIIEKYPNQIFHYSLSYHRGKDSFTGLDNFQKLVYNKLKYNLMIDIKEEENLTLSESIIRKSHRYFEKLYQNAYVSPYALECPYFEQPDEEYKYNLPLFTLITGPSGSGRKTTLAIKYKNSLKERNTISIPYVCSLNDQTSSVYEFAEFLKDLFYPFVSKSYSEDEFDASSTASLAELIDYADMECHQLINIFVMNADSSFISFIRALEVNLHLNRHVAFYIQVNEYQDMPLPFYKQNYHIELNDFTEEEKYGIIHSILKKRGKELPSSVIDTIIKKEGANSPLYLTLLIEKLLLFNKEDFDRLFASKNITMSQFMNDEVIKSGSTVKELAKELFALLKQRISSEVVEKLIAVLSIKELPLSKSDIKSLFRYHKWRFSELSLSLFTKLIPELFIQSDWQIHFFNDDIAEAAKEISKDYTDDVIDWIENSEVSINVSITLPFLYKRKRDVNKFLDLYLKEAKKMVEEASSDMSVEDSQVNVTYFAVMCLKQAVSEQDEFPLLLQKEFYRRLINGSVSNPLIACYYLTSYLEYHDDGGIKLQPLVKHYMELLRFYFDAYRQNPENEVIHVMALYIYQQSSYITKLFLYINEEEKQFINEVVAIFTNPDQQMFVEKLSQYNPLIAKIYSFSTIQSLLTYVDVFDQLPPQYQEQIMGVIEKTDDKFNDIPILERLLEEGINIETESQDLTASTQIISTTFLIKIFKNDYVYDVRLRNALQLIINVIDYISKNDVLWLYATINSQLFTSLELLVKYENHLLDEGICLENYEGINPLVVRYLMLVLTHQPYCYEALKILLEGAIFGVFEIQYHFLDKIEACIENMLSKTVEPVLCLRAATFVAKLENIETNEEKDELFFKVMSKFFDSLSYSKETLTEDAIINSFADCVGGYLLLLDREEDEEFIDEISKLPTLYLEGYSKEAIVELIHSMLE